MVISYTTLTLLTVALVGILAFTLIERYIQRQETESLTANAEAVARQAEGLLHYPPALYELAHTAAFLGNVRVKVLDSQKAVLVDSGDDDALPQVTWQLDNQMFRFEPRHRADPFPDIVFLFPNQKTPGPRPQDILEPALTLTGPTSTTITVARLPGTWGSRLVFEYGVVDEQTLVTQEEALAVPAANPLWDLIYGDEGSKVPAAEHVVTVPIGAGQPITGYVEVSNTLDYAGESLRTIRRAFVTAGLGVGLVAVLMGLIVGQGLTSPLRALGAAARQMSSGDLSVRARIRANDEIGALAGQFNFMAERLQESFAELAADRDALRHFIADASHELRTPLTALKTFVELLQGPAAQDPAAQSEFLSESQIQLDRLAWITENLLNLSRLDAHLVELDLDQHDLRDLISAVAASVRAVAHERQIEIALDLPAAPVWVSCDRGRMELVLSNLLDNALKYTPASGCVEMGTATDTQGPILWVRDNGMGIAPHDLPHIFQRFYRGQRGTAETTGSGLGLAIAHSIVRAHAGEMRVESQEGAGSRFTISLPPSE